MRKWQTWLIVIASVVVILTSGVTLINSIGDKASEDKDTTTGNETSCVQVVDM